MTQSPLSLFRGHQGRSLARALACLLLVNVILAGFHAGMTPTEAGTVLCTAASDSSGVADGGSIPPADLDHGCCLLGCVSAPLLLVAPTVELPASATSAAADPARIAPVAFSPGPHSPANRPRGPPVLA
jgi:hypothetical protein